MPTSLSWGLTTHMAGWAFTRGKKLPLRGVQARLGLLQEVWLPLLFGFVRAGLFEVLISRELLVNWMGEASGVQDILFGWLVGLTDTRRAVYRLPSGRLALEGRDGGVGPMLTFITAKSPLPQIRLFTWEIPLLGWAFVTARTVPSLLLPPIVGLIGQRLFALFPRS